MAHWAELDGNNKVIRVLVGDNNDPVADLDNHGFITQVFPHHVQN